MIVNNASRVFGTYQSPYIKSSAKTSKPRGDKDNDKLEISSQANDFQKIREVISRTSDIRQDKIAELKSKFDSGRYSVDSTEIAGRLLQA